MRVFLKVQPRAKKEYIRRVDAVHLTIGVKEAPERGRANAAALKAAAAFLGVSRSRVKIISGAASRKKIIEIS